MPKRIRAMNANWRPRADITEQCVGSPPGLKPEAFNRGPNNSREVMCL